MQVVSEYIITKTLHIVPLRYKIPNPIIYIHKHTLTVQGPVGKRNGGRTVVILVVSGDGEGIGSVVVEGDAVVVEGCSVVVEMDVVSVVMVVKVSVVT